MSIPVSVTKQSEIAPLARRHRRRVLRQLRISPRKLDGPGRGYLQLVARTMAKLDQLDAYFADHPFVREDGTVPPAAMLYPTLVNTSARVLNQLETHVAAMRPAADPWAACERLSSSTSVVTPTAAFHAGTHRAASGS